ncbi:MAG: hypothetical protein M0Z43_09705 [Acidithiobacillus sp.]|nr:hypothetical protein [Acidithiobacillus sp.]
MKAYALEIQAHTGSGLTTLCFSTAPPLVTAPTDTPPNVTFDRRIIQPGNYQVQAFSNGQTYGKSQVGYGEIILRNDDGALDYLMDYGFDGRPCVLRMREDDGSILPYPSGWKTVFTGTIDHLEPEWPSYNDGTIVMSLRDGMAGLHVKLPLAVYAGNNALPYGLEGTPSDLGGKTKPLLLGTCFNMSLQCVNTSLLIYAVSPPAGGLCDTVTDWDAIAAFDSVADFFGSVVSGPVITPLGTEYRRGGCSSTGITVYDSGVPLTQGADYTDETDLQTNAPAAGYFRVLPANGYVRLGSTPAGQVTCTASDNNGHDANTAGSIIRAVLRDYMQWDTSKFNIPELAALDAACNIPIGQLITQDTYVDDLLDAICNTVGACYYFDGLGVFRIFRVVDPATQNADIPISGYTVGAFKANSSVAGSGAGGVPNYQIRLRQQKNYTVQTSGLAGSSTAAWRSWVAQEYRENVSTSTSCKAKHLLSTEIALDTCFASDGQAESDRRLGLYSVRRDLLDLEIDTELWNTNPLMDWDAVSNFDAVTSFDQLDFTAFRIGQIVPLDLGGRFGYSPKNMLITGITPDLLQKKLTLTVWG